jgi:ADP-ribosyl-[dinitrogen reductase] hydrolase
MRGSCLCGAIVYEVDRLDMPILHCHCTTCRKAHAALFAPIAGVYREHFRWLRGEEKLSSYESSPGKLRYFCSVCGSHLVASRATQPHVVLRIATLDEDPHVSARGRTSGRRTACPGSSTAKPCRPTLPCRRPRRSSGGDPPVSPSRGAERAQ